MFNKIKDLKNLRDRANEMKKKLAEETVQTDAANGQVTLVMDGNMEILSVDIAETILTPDKKEELQQAVQSATNDAIKKVQRVMAQKLQGMSGLNLPSM